MRIKARVKTTKFGYCPKITVYDNDKILWNDEKRYVCFLSFAAAKEAAENWKRELLQQNGSINY